MDNWKPIHHHIFIGGLHRSGTSMLFQLLRDHPQISGFADTGVNEDEGQFLQSVYPSGGTYGGPGRFGFHPAAHVTERSRLATPENAQKLFDEWSRYWDLTKPYLLEKSPPNLLKSRFLQALFPTAYFIMLLRHPVAVAYATQKWTPRMPLYGLLWHWVIAHERFAADQNHLCKRLVLTYEALVAAPEQTMQQVYHFLGLAETPIKQPVQAMVNERYFAQWQDMRRTGRGHLYTRLITWHCERRINRFGYSFTDCTTAVAA